MGILALDDLIEALKVVHWALSDENHLGWPDDGNSHILTSVGNDGTSKEIGISSHEALLVEAEISEELSVLLEVLSKPWSRCVSDG